MKSFSRETKWGTYDGRRIKIKDLDDDHLVNIIFHVQQGNCLRDKFLGILLQEAKLRGLSDKFVNNGQVPHISKQGGLGIEKGTWALWDYDKNIPVQISLKQAQRT